MQTYYVSLVKDLFNVYLEFEAESEQAVHAYLEAEYLSPKGVWKLPWCAVYTKRPEPRDGWTVAPVVIVKAVNAPRLYNADWLNYPVAAEEAPDETVLDTEIEIEIPTGKEEI